MKKISLLIILIFTIISYAQSTTSISDSVSFLRKKDSITINTMLNNWHKAAATADENFFFSSISEDGIYIGTDATELWTKKVFEDWSKKYFERETAWDFKTISRNIYFTSQTVNIAWFNELLDTWMGNCRGSGILVKINGTWKIAQYHLAIAVPNDRVKDYLKLIKK